MNERESKVLALTRMFDAYQQVATPSRIDTYLDVIGAHIPAEAVCEGIRDAMRECEHFPPGPGPIRRAALACWRVQRERAPALPAQAERGEWRNLGPLLTSVAGRVKA